MIVTGTGDPALFASWASRVLAPRREPISGGDPVISALDAEFPGLGQLNSGDMADGAIFAIIGQSVSLASAGVTATRLCAMFHPGFALAGRRFWPMPPPEALAAASPADIRPCGVTGKRAEAIVAAATLFATGEVPAHPALFDESHAERLLATPGIGPWTVASTLLWGGGHPGAFPPGDAALLRAARAAYDRQEMDQRALSALARGWGSEQAVAARLLWTDLFGHPGDRHTPARAPRVAGR